MHMQITPTKCKPNDIQESCAGNHKSHETSDEADSEYDEIFLTPVPKGGIPLIAEITRRKFFQ